MYKSPYNLSNKSVARKLRRNSTFGERKLWKYIRNNQVQGYKFRRQYPMLSYVLDFYCVELRLAIELDGGSHTEERFMNDLVRQKKIENQNIKVLRFPEFNVLRSLDNVLQTIYNEVELRVEDLRKSTSP